jgi:hypothetical protein
MPPHFCGRKIEKVRKEKSDGVRSWKLVRIMDVHNDGKENEGKRHGARLPRERRRHQGAIRSRQNGWRNSLPLSLSLPPAKCGRRKGRERRQLDYELWRGASEKDESSRSRRSLRDMSGEAGCLPGGGKKRARRYAVLWRKKAVLAKRAHPRRWRRRVTGNALTATNDFRDGMYLPERARGIHAKNRWIVYVDIYRRQWGVRC